MINKIKLVSLYNDVTKEKILLNYPINFKIECDKYGYYYINEKFNLYVYGETQEEAEDKLVDAFKEQLNIFAYEEDNKLDKNALDLKNKLLGIYKSFAK